MKASKLIPLVIALVLVATLALAAGAQEQMTVLAAGPCTAGAAYDPACDVDHDGDVDIFDIQLSAGHWNQTGTFTSDNNHNHLGQTWTGNNNPFEIEGSFAIYPDHSALAGSNTAQNSIGVRGEANASGSVGVWGQSTANTGVFGLSTNGVGVWGQSTDSTGVRAESTNSFGVYVPAAGFDGLHVSSAGLDGLYVYSADLNGVGVVSADYDGVYANTAQASGEWGLATPDKIHGSNVTLSSLTVIAQVTGEQALSTGDVVAAVGVTDPLPGSTVRLALVSLADAISATGIVGVVEGRMALTAQPQRGDEPDAEPVMELRSAEGPAQPGDYVALTVFGVAQVKVQDGTAIVAGERLTAGDGGGVRALQTRFVEGMVVTEGAPMIGVALEAPKEGLVWVLVNVQ